MVRQQAEWVWEGSSLAVRVQESGQFLPGEQFRVLGNSPTQQQLQLYMNLMKTHPLPSLFLFHLNRFVSLSHQTARAWISAHLYSHHFGGKMTPRSRDHRYPFSLPTKHGVGSVCVLPQEGYAMYGGVQKVTEEFYQWPLIFFAELFTTLIWMWILSLCGVVFKISNLLLPKMRSHVWRLQAADMRT